MAVVEFTTSIYSVGVIDWDRRLFDELIPLPDGTSYNAYLIVGSEKVALIDTVDPSKQDELIANLEKLGVERIDYVISNHAEQDHSGAIPKVLELYPNAKVVTNHKCKQFLQELLLIPEEKFMTVADGDELPLGNRTLQFIITPWTHWPETMCTYVPEDKLLFPCDLFGSHYATSELFVVDEAKAYYAAKRYYAEIMMPFRTTIRKHLGRIEHLSIEMIAPSHGPIYDNPNFIITAYREWTSDEVKNEVIIAFISMHRSTAKMVQHLTNALIERGITVKVFNLSRTDIGELAIALVDAATLIIASPTVLAGPHPTVVCATYLVNALRPKLKFASIIGSYGWGGKMADQIKGMLSNLKVELLEPVIAKGHPKIKDFEALNRLADEIAKKHQENDMVK